MQPNSRQKYSTFIYLECGQCGKEEKKIEYISIYLYNEEGFLDKIKSIFYRF